MLQLKNITKIYGVDETEVHALKGVSLNFRKSEFVSILGQSGCGKTTLLNIVGGLDRYTDGDLVINGVSTKDYSDRDWDTYRNHLVGFVFQSYNLIPHQTVLKNVELALTLSGVSREERRKRAQSALERVGLGGQLSKRPNQLSGGQMQRVAIARAIVNDPQIILADEPTGALDSETSVQVMEILKELSKDRLVVMVTHNAELAEEYSTRTVKLSDGLVISDTDPYEGQGAEMEGRTKSDAKGPKKPSMSFLTALSLSLNNLFTKKGRTILTSFAGSIGIIGIALILSLSAGFNTYVQNVQRDTLSNYPITITTQTVDTAGLIANFLGKVDRDGEAFPDEDKITSQNVIGDMLSTMAGNINTNDLAAFKTFIDGHADDPAISSIYYNFGLRTNVYDNKINPESGNYESLSPLTLPTMESIFPSDVSIGKEAMEMINYYYDNFETMMSTQNAFSEMIDNEKLIKSQYDLLQGKWPSGDNDAILVIDNYNQLSDLVLYMLGLMNDDDVRWAFYRMILSYFNTANNLEMTDEEIDDACNARFERSLAYTEGLSFDSLIGLEYNILVPTDHYKKVGYYDEARFGERGAHFAPMTDGEKNDLIATGKTEKIKIVGIVRLKEGTASGSLLSTVCYKKALTDKLIKRVEESDLAKSYNDLEFTQTLREEGDLSSSDYFNVFGSDGNWANNYETHVSLERRIGLVDTSSPVSISIYPTDFEAKDRVIALIEEYNSSVEKNKQIKYTDYVGALMSSVTDIVNAVSYVLIAFVSISLIVSTIMIAIITYISVLERTKEIGVLRSLGASKRDIARVFNAETAIIGTIAGVMGIGITLLLNLPINAIIAALAGLTNVASLPVIGAIALIAISIGLTIVAGLVPARMASKKDPVIALRTE